MLKTIINYLTILLSKNYDKKIINKLNLLNIKPEIIFDIGCHVGEQTELFLRSFSSINKIYCFISVFIKLHKRNIIFRYW